MSAGRPELLAPAGNWDALRAAAANGADAVYFGLSNFNARHRAANFRPDELPDIMRFLHDRNVRGYVTLNTLIFSDELEEVSRLIAAIAEARVDAVIVQDLGLARLIRALVPQLAIHGSTQMTLTEARAIEMVRALGVERVILARELAIKDIAEIRAATDMPLEVFIHGALCVAYSGQCLTSEALGGRSANRGQCAQACRMPYDLIVDDQQRDTEGRSYLLSPQDLAGFEQVDELLRAGVVSLKIEGRLKTPEYVAVTTQTYRAAIDAAVEGRAFELSTNGQRDLAQLFSRGLTPGFLAGLDHQTLVAGRFPKSRGVRVGTVRRVTQRGVVVELASDFPASAIKAGDGVVFDEGKPEENERGGRVFHVNPASGAGEQVELTFDRSSLRPSDIPVGSLVWRTDDPALRRRLQQSFATDAIHHREPLDFTLRGELGGPLTLVAREATGGSVEAMWPGPVQTALKHALDQATLAGQLDRLGDTPWRLGTVVLKTPPGIMAPRSVLNDLRRQVVEQLLRARYDVVPAVHREALERLRQQIHDVPKVATPDDPQLFVLVRNLEQLEAVASWRPTAPRRRPAMLYCDFEDVRRYREAVPIARAAGLPIGLATLRVLKPGEEGWLAHIARAEGDAILVRNLTSLHYFRELHPTLPLLGDFSLNVANELTADWFLEQGLARLVPSYDLNWDQFASLMRRGDAGRFEAVIHQHMPMFHNEHCVFAAMLSTGKDWRDCGRPCDHHKVQLRDRTGAEFPLLADAGCRNTVFNSVAQSAAEFVPRMLSLGVRHFRVELLRETAADTVALLDRYSGVLAGLETGRAAWRHLQVIDQLGVTRGTMHGV